MTHAFDYEVGFGGQDHVKWRDGVGFTGRVFVV